MEKKISRRLKCKYCDWTTPRRRGCQNRLEDHVFGKHPEGQDYLMHLMQGNLVLFDMEDQLQEHQLIC